MRTVLTAIALNTIAGLLSATSPASPIVFEENRGQEAPEVLFLSRAARYGVFLTRDGAVISASGGAVVRLGMTGASAASPVGLGRLAARSNYLVGSDPARWHTGISNYERVRYAHAWPGIDVVWYGRAGRIEHDFVVAPGADPRQIRLLISGATVELSPGGGLIAGPIRLHQPHAYQEGREIACRYERRGRSIGFALGKYDRGRPLTIDPVLSFSTFLGSVDSATAVRVDSAGSIYVAGVTSSPSFPVSAKAFQTTPPGGSCSPLGTEIVCPKIFVTKFTGDGSTLLFSTFLGGAGGNSLIGMTIDPSGNVYLAGYPDGPDFPKLTPLPGYSVPPSGPFVAKISSDGASLLYATLLPLPGETLIKALAVDSAGAIYLTGSSLGGLPVVNAYQSAHAEALIFKTTDSAVDWQGLMDGLPDAGVETFALDPSNPQTMYLGQDGGLYKSTDAGAHWTPILQGKPPQATSTIDSLEPTSVAVDPLHPQTVYLGTLFDGIYKSTDGGASWAPAGAGATGFVRLIAIDPTNTTTLYAGTDAGLYKSTDGAITWNPTGLVAEPTEAFYIYNVVLNPAAPATVYAATTRGVVKTIDGGSTWAAMNNGFPPNSGVYAVVIDPANTLTLYAATNDDNVAPYRTSDGGAHWTEGQWPAPLPNDFLYVECMLVDPLVHSTIWAGTDEGILVSRDSGATWAAPATGLPLTSVRWLAADSAGTLYATSGGGLPDAFAMKLDPTGSQIVYSTYLGGTGSDTGYGIAVDAAGRAYVTGQTDSYDFPVAGALQPHAGGRRDAFVSVLDPTGAHLVWSTFLGGSDDDSASAVALDPAGNVHLAGWTESPDFPLHQPSQPQLGGNQDAFVAKLKADGSALIFSTYLGGSDVDFADAVAADAAGNTYAAGVTYSKDLPTANAVQPALAGTINALVGAWNGQTGALQYATYLGGSGSDSAASIAADANGHAYIAGTTSSPDFPSKYAFQYSFLAACTPESGRCFNQDAFLAKIAPQGTGPAIALAGVSSAAGDGTAIAPGEIVSIYGSALAVTPAVADGPPLPLQLSDLQVSVNGVAAPLYYVSPAQVNAQIPFETPLGIARIQVSSSAGAAALSIGVSATAPAIFAGAIEHALTGQLVTGTNPAASGEIVAIYCTGLGAVNPPAVTGAAPTVPPPQTVLPVEVSIAGASANVSYAGLAPGFAGLYQVNAQVPAGIPSGLQNLQLSARGVAANAVTVAIR